VTEDERNSTRVVGPLFGKCPLRWGFFREPGGLQWWVYLQNHRHAPWHCCNISLCKGNIGIHQQGFYCSKTYTYSGTYIIQHYHNPKQSIGQVSAEQLPDDGFEIEHNISLHPFIHELHHDRILHPSHNDSSHTEANSQNESFDPEQTPFRSHIYGTPHLDDCRASKLIREECFDIFDGEIHPWSSYSCEEEYRFLHWFVKHNFSIAAINNVLQEPYDFNHQQLHFIPHFLPKVVENVWRDGNQLLEIGHTVLSSFGRSKHPWRWWLHTILLLQSCRMHRLTHATSCIQGTYVVCSSTGIQRCWGTCLLSSGMKRLVMQWTSMFVECCHSYHDFNRFNWYSGRFELQLTRYWAVLTGHIVHTIRVRWRNGQ